MSIVTILFTLLLAVTVHKRFDDGLITIIATLVYFTFANVAEGLADITAELKKPRKEKEDA